MQKKESITCVILSSDYSLGDSLGDMYVSVHKLEKQICKICDYHYFM